MQWRRLRKTPSGERIGNVGPQSYIWLASTWWTRGKTIHVRYIFAR